MENKAKGVEHVTREESHREGRGFFFFRLSFSFCFGTKTNTDKRKLGKCQNCRNWETKRTRPRTGIALTFTAQTVRDFAS